MAVSIFSSSAAGKKQLFIFPHHDSDGDDTTAAFAASFFVVVVVVIFDVQTDKNSWKKVTIGLFGWHMFQCALTHAVFFTAIARSERTKIKLNRTMVDVLLSIRVFFYVCYFFFVFGECFKSKSP